MESTTPVTEIDTKSAWHHYNEALHLLSAAQSSLVKAADKSGDVGKVWAHLLKDLVGNIEFEARRQRSIVEGQQ